MMNSQYLINFPSQTQIQREILRRKLKGSYYEFLKYFWGTIIPDEFVDNWHIKYLCDELQHVALRVKDRLPKEYDLLINIPPGTSKSTIVTIMYPAWVWTIDQTQRFITASYAAELSTEHAVKTRDLIRSDKYQELFPEVVLKYDQDNKTNYANQQQGSRVATSVGGTITGKHGHQIIIDDPQNPKESLSDASRSSVNSWLDNTIPTRKVDKAVTPTIMIMQRLNEGDASGYWLQKKSDIKHICLPAELTDDVKPPELREKYIDGLLDPRRLSRPILDALKIDLGSYNYAGQMLERPAPPEGGIIKKDWFNKFSANEIPENLTRHYITDSAYGKEGSDNSATLAYSVYNNNLYLWAIGKVNLDFNDFVRHFQSFLLATGWTTSSIARFEPKASGTSLIQYLKRNLKMGDEGYGVNVTEIKDKSLADSKETRVQSITPFLESGRVYLHDGFDWQDFLNECAQFPNGRNDDQVDVLTYAVILELLRTRARAFANKPVGF